MTPSPPRLLARISGVIREALNVDVPTVDTDLLDAGLLDSLGLVELIAELEQEFACELALDFDVECFQSVERIADFLRSTGALDGIPSCEPDLPAENGA